MCILKVGSKKQPIGRYGFIWGNFPLIFGIYKKKNLSKWFLSIINKKVKILSLFFFSEKSRGGSQGAQGTSLHTLWKYYRKINNIMAKLYISVFTKLSYKYYLNFPNTEISGFPLSFDGKTEIRPSKSDTFVTLWCAYWKVSER